MGCRLSHIWVERVGVAFVQDLPQRRLELRLLCASALLDRRGSTAAPRLTLCRNMLVVMQEHRVGIVEKGVHSLPE